MESKRERAARGLYNLGNFIVRITGSLIFSFLVCGALVYTQYMPPGGSEIPLNRLDSPLYNLLTLTMAGGMFALLAYLEKHLDAKARLLSGLLSGIAMVLWIAGAGIWWINASAHLPQGDQAYIYGGASYFMAGQYDFLAPGGYCHMYPYQLGLIALCELLFHLAGAFNYYAFEVICVILAAGSACCGYFILRELTGNGLAVVGYNILMMGCLPLIFYTSWVYGDLPSIFFALLAAWMLVAYSARSRYRYLVVMAIAMTFAMLVRRNSMIFMIAAGIVILLHTFRHKDKKILLVFLVSVLLSQCAYGIIYKMYEVRSGYEHSEGMSMLVWFATGLEETKGSCGWDNDYYKQVYFESGYDLEAVSEAARESISDRLETFQNDPVYAGKFFGKKLLSQWNGPLYQALFFNSESPDLTGGPKPDSLAAGLWERYYEIALAFCDRWQFVVYVGMLCYFLFCVKRESELLWHVTAIAIIGGFLYSIFSEAKGRYAFPYYVMMFPFAAYGLKEAVCKGNTFCKRLKACMQYKKSP